MAQQQELLVVHIGKETTWGVGVAGTVKVPALTDVTLSPTIEVGDFPTLEGLAPIYSAAIVKDGGEGSVSGILNYDDLPYWLNSLFGEDATPVGDPTLTPTNYTWSYAGPHSAAVSSPDIFSLYYGTSTSGYRLLGAIVSTLEMSGSSGEEIQIGLGFIGKKVAALATVPTGLSDRSVTLAVSSDMLVWIDDDLGSSFGTTPWTCTAYSFSLSLNANRNVIYALGGIAPCSSYHQRFDGTLDLSLEFPGGSDYTKDLLEGLLSGPTLQQQCIRLKITTDTKHIIQIDFAGTLMDAPDIFTDSDGISTVDMSWKGTYDSSNGLWCDIDVTNTISDLWV